MKSNVTLKIDTELLREAKILAAQRNTSVSRLLADQLELLVRRDKAYDVAKRRALARREKGFNLDGVPPKSREERHER